MAEVQRGKFIEFQDGEVLEGEELSDEEKAFQEFRNSLNAGEEMATVRVSRIPKSNITGHATNAKSIYCFAYPVDRYTFEELCEFIRENYGGGLYRLLGTKKGHRGAAFNQLLELAEPVRPKQTGDPSQPQNPSAVMESVAAMLTAAQERWEGMFTRLGAINGNPQILPPPTDPFETMQKMITMLAAMGVIGPKPVDAGGGVVAELTKLAQIKELIGGFNDGGGTSAAESNFYDLATQGLKTVAPLLANLPAVLASRQGAPPVQPHVIEHELQPVPAPRTNIPRSAPPPPSGDFQGSQKQGENVNLRNQVNLLVAQADAGTSVENLANMVLDITPNEKVPELKAFLSRPTFIDEMAACNSAVTGKHRDYFRELRRQILEMLSAEESAVLDDSTHDA